MGDRTREELMGERDRAEFRASNEAESNALMLTKVDALNKRIDELEQEVRDLINARIAGES